MSRPAAMVSLAFMVPATIGIARTTSLATTGQGQRMSQEAKGNFDVEVKPEATLSGGIGRFSINKTFHGDIDGRSVGEMLAVRTATQGSAGYVLIEHVTVALGGRSGGFLLQHHGLMDRGTPELKVVIIPDSGTGELAGIAGSMTINAADNHSYVLTYSLPTTS